MEAGVFFGKAQVEVEDFQKLVFHGVDLGEVEVSNSVGSPVNVLRR